MNLENLSAGSVKNTMKAVGAGSSDLWNVPVAAVKVLPGFNVRTRNATYAAHIAALGESILANGYYRDRPLSGYVASDGSVYVTDGHSRLEAIAYANERGASIESVPVVTKPAGTSVEDLTVGLVMSNSGKPLAPIEKAEVVKRLLSYGMAEETIAKRLGVTAGYVKDLLMLAGAPKAIRKLVEDDAISAANAVAMMKKHGDKALEVIEAALGAAAEKGETKVSKKSLKAPKAEKEPAPSLLEIGVNWISQRDEKNIRPFVEMLAHLTETPVEVINEMLAG